ncbi:hypothetical protein OOT33_12115 [Sphingobium sp. DEHP117]|uniref:hypothetical protein n=1 Tax=Sphingobium sp. DEHP117 TaxID=2993436 RepID=UPI0027D6A9A9|nr:hypothetical protein [Sphingobium sp. DEHP117]MDQ4421173.1 hypothetical protein [Sphingobium sp. DEHP117]
MRPEAIPSPNPDIAAPIIAPLGLRGKIADELDQLREDLEEIGVQLCLDEEVMLRCMEYLQRLDEMGQRSNWLAAIVRAEDPIGVLPDITLQALADRLKG